MKKTLSKILIPVFLCVGLVPSLASGQIDITPMGGKKFQESNIRIGRVEIHPGFGADFRYESNVFLEADETFVDGSNEGRTEDYVYSNRPSMGLALQKNPGDIFGFALDYEGEDTHWDELKDVLNAFNHDLSGKILLGGRGGRSELITGGSYVTSNSLDSVTDLDFQSNFGNRITNKIYKGYSDFTYIHSKFFKTQLEFDYQRREFGGSVSQQNTDIYDFGGSFFYQARPLLSYGVKYFHKRRFFDAGTLRNLDSDSDRAFIGAKWEPTALLSGELSVGFDYIRFKKVSTDNLAAFVYLLNMTYHPTQRTEFVLSSKREIINTTFQFVQAAISTRLDLGVTQQLGRKFSLEMVFRYQNLDYQRAINDSRGGDVLRTRIDNAVFTSMEFSYFIQDWLTARTNYTWANNTSTFRDRDFNSHTFLVAISARY